MPVSVAAGVEVVFDDREPPGVDAAAAVVGVVAPLAVVVVVFVPATVVVVAPAAAVVVVVPLPLVVVVVLLFLLDPEAAVCEPDVFFVAEGLDEPQAAAIRPAATTTPAIRSDVATRRGARSGVGGVESIVGTVIRPHSCCLRAAGPKTPPPPLMIDAR
jgi:hypothetical protein